MFDSRDLIVLVLTVATFFWIQRMFFNQSGETSQQVQAGQSYALPTADTLSKPANRSVKFIEEKLPSDDKEERITVNGENFTATFSTFGGVLASFTCGEYTDRTGESLKTVFPRTVHERQDGLFLVALDQETPYVYTHDSTESFEDYTEVTLSAQSRTARIIKTFIVHHDKYQIDLRLNVKSYGSSSVTPRIFVCAPFLNSIKDNGIQAITSTLTGDSLEKTTIAKAVEKAWVMPKYFGVENKYFLHIMRDDKDGFTQRAYYRKIDAVDSLSAVLEGPEISDSKTFTLSWYVGPKTPERLTEVDDRLEDSLSFGWFSYPIKQLLKLLLYVEEHVGNFGIAIILLVILLRLLVFPLTVYQRRIMHIKQKLDPREKHLRKIYKDDNEKFVAELTKLYNDHGLSMFAPFVAMFITIFTQLPLTIMMWRLLGSSIDLYGAPFFAWVTDLSQPDPYYILPVISSFAIVLSSLGEKKVNPIMYVLPFITLSVAINFPAGLILFFATFGIISIAENMIINRVYPVKS